MREIDISVTRSRKVRSSHESSNTLSTRSDAGSSCRTSNGPQHTSRSTSWPKSTAPDADAAATCVLSAVHARSKSEPQLRASRAYDHPVLSHSRSMLNEPAAKYRPLGAHATDVTEYSICADE